MNNIIDETYFVRENFINDLSIQENKDELNSFISQYQDEFLKRVFGSKITDEQITLLLPKLVDSNKKVCPLANYIYCIYQSNNSTFTTAAGEKNLNVPNTSIADDRFKRANSWNKMVNMLQELHQNLYNTKIEGIDYLNDILFNLSTNTYKSVVLPNRTISLQIFGGIFSYKTKYDFE